MLNKQGQGKIDWCNYSFNPISGRCLHNCSYCYMHSIWRRFPDHAKSQFKKHYLDIRLPQKSSKIFVGSSTDMWGDWISSEWIQRVLDFVRLNPQHTFQFLTKNPKRYAEFDLPKNGWYGTTVDGTEKTKDNLRNLTLIYLKSFDLKVFISFEPLIKLPDFNTWDFVSVDWMIIGADSSKGAKKAPIEWADAMIQKAKEYNVPVWVKDNYGYPKTIKEFPENKE